jgi:hypothetical protein
VTAAVAELRDEISSLFLRWIGAICKNDFVSPLQPSEHSHVSKLFEKRKIGSLHAYGNVCVAVLGWTCSRSACAERRGAFDEVEAEIRCRLHSRGLATCFALRTEQRFSDPSEAVLTFVGGVC